MKKGVVLWIGAQILCMPLSFGQSWESYDSENSMLPRGGVHAIYIDIYGGKWLGTNEGLVYFNEAGWSVYREEEGLISRLIKDLSAAVNLVETKLYVSTNQGVSEVFYDASGVTDIISRFDGFSWRSYPFIDGISEYEVFDLDFDLDGSIWFATDFGLLHHDELGIPEGIDPEQTSTQVKFRIFPTIAREDITLEYTVPAYSPVSIFVMDLTGKVVCRLAEHMAGAGSHSFTWNLKDPYGQVPAGPYFIALKTDQAYISKIIMVY